MKSKRIRILAISVLACVLCITTYIAGAARVPTAGYNTCGAATDDTASGDTTWTNVANMQGANDGVYATQGATNGSVRDQVSCQTFAFAIPTTATINGVEVLVRNKTSNATGGGSVVAMHIQKNGASTGNNKTGSALTTSDRDDTYGSGSDLWGNALTPSDINANNTGVYFGYGSTSLSTRTISVDSVQMRITYTAATTDTSKFLPFFTWLRLPTTYTATQTRSCQVMLHG